MRSGPTSKILILAGAIVVFALPLSASQAGTRSSESSAAPAVAKTFYFHGVPADQANKTASFVNEQPPPPGSLTFDETNTFDAAPVAQSAACSNTAFVPNQLAAWWVGPFTGTINGTLTLDWWWQITNPAGIALGVIMNIKVVADPDFTSPGVGTQTIIGETSEVYTFPDVQPKRFITSVPVSGTVASRLLIQAGSVVQTVCAVELGLSALYDHATTPSKFSFDVPTAATVVSFTRKATGRKVVALTWRTGSERDLVGFNVWRGNGAAKGKVNPALIAARGAVFGATYSLVDRSARVGKSYTYGLQLVHRDGSRSWYSGARVRVAR